jgi:hypothetical protein
MSPTYIATLYRNSRWSVLDCRTHVFYFIGQSKVFCVQRARELNAQS